MQLINLRDQLFFGEGREGEVINYSVSISDEINRNGFKRNVASWKENLKQKTVKSTSKLGRCRSVWRGSIRKCAEGW